MLSEGGPGDAAATVLEWASAKLAILGSDKFLGSMFVLVIPLQKIVGLFLPPHF